MVLNVPFPGDVIFFDLCNANVLLMDYMITTVAYHEFDISGFNYIVHVVVKYAQFFGTNF